MNLSTIALWGLTWPIRTILALLDLSEKDFDIILTKEYPSEMRSVYKRIRVCSRRRPQFVLAPEAPPIVIGWGKFGPRPRLAV
jgi:hypothetical protein